MVKSIHNCCASIIFILLTLLNLAICAPPYQKSNHHNYPPSQNPLNQPSGSQILSNHTISTPLFHELEELSRIVDIAYCVGTSGIYAPFNCISRCSEFPAFELVNTWNTGPLLSDSCGYIALDHGKRRIIVAFRGTYSIANTIVDLSTVPQEYLPYPGNDDDKFVHNRRGPNNSEKRNGPVMECTNCTVHSGFYSSWTNTRHLILPHIASSQSTHPTYALHLVGHSLGGAVAALAGLELQLMNYEPTITTFGEPRIGNIGLRNWLDGIFNLTKNDTITSSNDESRYRRITHINDPVPLLPLMEWGFRQHAGELFIEKGSLSPEHGDIRACVGDEDIACIAGQDTENSVDSLRIPARYKMWQLLFAHRDYFWRLGLCVPGGDPFDWGRGKYGEHDDEVEL